MIEYFIKGDQSNISSKNNITLTTIMQSSQQSSESKTLEINPSSKETLTFNPFSSSQGAQKAFFEQEVEVYDLTHLLSLTFSRYIPSKQQLEMEFAQKFLELRLTKEQYQEEIQITNSLDVKSNLSHCFEAKWKNDKWNREVFVKFVIKDKLKRKTIENEILFQLYAEKNLPDNVVKILGWLSEVPDQPDYAGIIIMEMGTCDLQKVLDKHDLTNKTQQLIDQVVKIGMTLRLINLTHQDLKPEQFIYFSESNLLKLTDFGSAFYEGVNISDGIQLKQMWQPTTPKYHSTQYYQFWISKKDVFYTEFTPVDLKLFYCYICYKFDSYAIGLIILKLIFPKIPSYRVKKLLMALSPSKITREDIKAIISQQQQIQPEEIIDSDIDEFRSEIKKLSQEGQYYKQQVEQTRLKLMFKADSTNYRVPIDKTIQITEVFKLVEQDYMERKNLSQIFLDSTSVRHDYNARFKYALHAYLDDQHSLFDDLEDVMKFVQGKKNVRFPNFDLMEFSQQQLQYPPYQEAFEYEGDYNYLEGMYNSMKAIGVTQIEGKPYNFQNYILFLAEKESIDPERGSMKRLCKYYYRETLKVDYFLFENFLTEQVPKSNIRIPLEPGILDSRLASLQLLMKLGCVVVIILDVQVERRILLSQNFIVKEIILEKRVVKAICGRFKHEKTFDLNEMHAKNVRVFLKEDSK